MGGDSVSSLNALNEKYKNWMKDSKAISGSAGTCNASANYSTSGKYDANAKKTHDYYLCGAKTEGGKCRTMDWDDWDGTWGNCQKGNGDNQDKCYNAADMGTPGVKSGDAGDSSPFSLGDLGSIGDTYDPAGTGKCPNADSLVHGVDTVRCQIGDVSDGAGGQMRPAYPNSAEFLHKLKNSDGGSIDAAWTNESGWLGNEGLNECPENTQEQIRCSASGRDWTDPGCAFVTVDYSNQGTFGGVGAMVRFCSRPKSDYDNTNIAKCCLGSLADGPETKTDGTLIGDDHSCPKDFCVTRVAEGTDATINCNYPKTDGDETFCYKMSDKCNTFFKEICTTDVFKDESDDNYQHCVDWGHIQPTDFIDKAHEVCDIGDYSSNPPNKSDLRNIQKVMNTPLCRDYIIENLPREQQKLRNLCQHYKNYNSQEDSWYEDPSLELNGEDILKDICPCYYPDDFYEWYRNSLDRDVGTCSDPDGHPDYSVRTKEECDRKEGYNWTTSAGQSQIVAAINDREMIKPECYYPACTRSLLYKVDDSGCSTNLNLCYQELTQQNIVFGGKIDPSTSDLTSGRASQTCNQQQLLSTPSQSPTPTPTSPTPSPSDSFLGGLLGTGSGSGSGGGDGGGDDDNTTTIIIVIVVILIIIGGIFAVVMMNKGGTSPPEQIANPEVQLEVPETA